MSVHASTTSGDVVRIAATSSCSGTCSWAESRGGPCPEVFAPAIRSAPEEPGHRSRYPVGLHEEDEQEHDAFDDAEVRADERRACREVLDDDGRDDRAGDAPAPGHEHHDEQRDLGRLVEYVGRDEPLGAGEGRADDEYLQAPLPQAHPDGLGEALVLAERHELQTDP